ncbi:MAG: glycoside hydrolase family 31 protein [Ignavibacteria bacterium]|jgi:alpha-glucosidase (family GH31 glycosyl hydrolase)
MKKRVILVITVCIVVIIFLITFSKGSGISINTIGRNQDIHIKFNSYGLKTELEILPNEEFKKGSIFFETEEGVTWLRNKPDCLDESDRNIDASWNIDNRKVIINIKQDKNNFNVEFKAEPSDDILKWGFNLKADKDEYFTGLFERVTDGNQKESWKEGITAGMNLRGQTVDMIIKHTLSLYSPFYYSSKGYGLFVKGTWPGHYDICKENENLMQIEFEGQSLEFIIYTSDSPAEIIKQHSLNVGPTILPPKWAFMPYRWRDNHTNQSKYFDSTVVNSPYNSMIVEDILMMQALDIPCGIYWVDRPWAVGNAGYEDFNWDRKRIPNPENMIRWLEKKNIRFLLWIAPWVIGDMADTAKARGFYLPSQKSPERVLIDFSNPEAVKWWQEEGLAKVLQIGVKGFKLDRGEELVPETRNIKINDGRTARENRNDYVVQYLKATNEITKKYNGDDFVLLPRAGYTGSSRYGVFWGGDIGSPQEGLRCAIIALQRSSVIGFPIWGSDTGGYWQGDLDREILARWLAFSCFCPLMEVGPTEDRGLWDMKKEPNYDSEVLAIWRTYAKIHTKIVDYSYMLAKEAHESGMPIVRPLFMEEPDEISALENWQTFLYGHDILVSAIWQKGQTVQKVYLPGGDEWYDAWDPQKVYDGGQVVDIEVPLFKIPIFIRRGADIDLGDLNKLYEESLKIVSIKPDLSKLQENEQW